MRFCCRSVCFENIVYANMMYDFEIMNDWFFRSVCQICIFNTKRKAFFFVGLFVRLRQTCESHWIHCDHRCTIWLSMSTGFFFSCSISLHLFFSSLSLESMHLLLLCVVSVTVGLIFFFLIVLYIPHNYSCALFCVYIFLWFVCWTNGKLWC